VAIVIFWPGLVTMFLDKPIDFDPDKVKIEIEQTEYGRAPNADDVFKSPAKDEEPDPARGFK
ncbi:MAG: hypothetical protein H7X75_05945, partial [Burkholderiaceae bacterium]|nr:hypothetical protein [Burkholderiaceae bacterium]